MQLRTCSNVLYASILEEQVAGPNVCIKEVEVKQDLRSYEF